MTTSPEKKHSLVLKQIYQYYQEAAKQAPTLTRNSKLDWQLAYPEKETLELTCRIIFWASYYDQHNRCHEETQLLTAALEKTQTKVSERLAENIKLSKLKINTYPEKENGVILVCSQEYTIPFSEIPSNLRNEAFELIVRFSLLREIANNPELPSDEERLEERFQVLKDDLKAHGEKVSNWLGISCKGGSLDASTRG